MSALAALRCEHADEPATALRCLLRWLATQETVFTTSRAGMPLMVVDPDFGGTLALVPERALLPHDVGEAELAALDS
jgi:hypothetical protein